MAAAAHKASTGIIKPALQLFGVEGRYAHALFSAATKKNQLETVEKELKEIQKRAAKDKAFANFLETPIKSRLEKQQGITAILKAAKFSDLTVNFFSVLAENNRLTNAVEVAQAFESLLSSHRGEVQCSVTSAEPLPDKVVKSLKESLAGFAKKGEVLKIETKVDPTILGGLIVDVGDKHIDMSIATSIKKYTQLLRAPLQ